MGQAESPPIRAPARASSGFLGFISIIHLILPFSQKSPSIQISRLRSLHGVKVLGPVFTRGSESWHRHPCWSIRGIFVADTSASPEKSHSTVMVHLGRLPENLEPNGCRDDAVSPIPSGKTVFERYNVYGIL
ncbi:hypothetical protein BJX63DRAFT_177190 [Aspergillus granulosus]|uniref:Uncharacterized protein n=1 Tax=Aspergillus granulosus TaxID=176169 RepID=A0ABR4I2J4_9EURO